MKNPVTTLFFLMMLAPAGHADQAEQCSQRIVNFAQPIFPKSLAEIKILERQHFCAIDLAYSINMEGRAENIEYRSSRGVCKPFNVPAIRAVRSSQFSAGEYLQLCFITLTFSMQNGQPQWRYGAFQPHEG